MRGQIIKRSSKKGSDSWSIVISTGKDEKTGKYKKVWHCFHGTSKEAQEELTRLLHEKDTGVYIQPSKNTLGEFLNSWLQNAKPGLSPRTAEGYESIIRVHLIPALGTVKLSKLRPEAIQAYYNQKLSSGRFNGKGGLSPTTVRHHAMCLHAALDSAVRLKLLSINPADSVDAPPMKQSEIDIMDENDLHLFLEAAKGTPDYPMIYTALFTGMRRSELLALRWQDIELIMCQVSVNRSLHRLHDGTFIFRQPKTTKSKRTIALTPSNALVLRELKDRMTAQRIVSGTTLKESDLVFSNEDGSPLNPDILTHHWKYLAKKLGMNTHLHSARHIHASLMLKQGVSAKVVQERLGHTTITTTMNIYSHVMPGLQEAAAKRFDDLLVKQVNQ